MRCRACYVVTVVLLLAVVPVISTGATPAPEPIGSRAKSFAEISACDCDLCGSKGMASPPDGKVNVHDILKFLVHMHAGSAGPMATDDHPCDINQDAIVDVSDLLTMFKLFGSTCAEHEDAGWHGVHFGGDWSPLQLFDKPQESGL